MLPLTSACRLALMILTWIRKIHHVVLIQRSSKVITNHSHEFPQVRKFLSIKLVSVRQKFFPSRHEQITCQRNTSARCLSKRQKTARRCANTRTRRKHASESSSLKSAPLAIPFRRSCRKQFAFVCTACVNYRRLCLRIIHL